MNIVHRRAALVVYLILVACATLWPALRLPDMDVPRPDLIGHASMFGLLTLLMILARPGGPPTLGARNIATGALISLAIASTLEAAQAMPFLRRSCGWDDGIANAVGVIGVTTLCLVVGALDDQKRTGRTG